MSQSGKAHVLDDLVQKYPVDDMQFELPHLQPIPAEFDVIPLVIAQVVEGRGEQELEASTQ